MEASRLQDAVTCRTPPEANAAATSLNSTSYPTIISLHELEINMSDKLKTYLAKSLQGLYYDDKEQKATDHINRILRAMKISPQRTICRIQQHTIYHSTHSLSQNLDTTVPELLLSTTDDARNNELNLNDGVKRQLNHFILKWMKERQDMKNDSNNSNNSVDECNVGSNEKCMVNKSDINPLRIAIDDHPYLENVVAIEISHAQDDAADEFPLINSYYQRVPDVLEHAKNSGVRGMRNDGIARKDDDEWKLMFPQWSSKISREKYGWPVTHRVIICDRYCGEAVIRGSDIYVRGIMIADSAIQANEIVAVYADCSDNTKCHSRGMILNDEIRTGRFVYLGLGQTACKRSHMFNQSNGLGMRMLLQSRYIMNAPNSKMTILPPFSGILSKQMSLQNEPSILVAQTLLSQLSHRLLPYEGKKHTGDNDQIYILDMCCAPGGKTLHLASIAHNYCMNMNHEIDISRNPVVKIIAADKSRKKILAAKEFFEQMDADRIIIPLALDSTKCVYQNYPKERTMNVSEVSFEIFSL